MGRLLVARRRGRRGLFLPREGSKANPSLLFPLDGVDRSELDELVRAILAKGGVTNEADVQAVVDRAEQDSEIRIKIAEARAEVRRLMAIRAKGISLIQIGWRKWREAFFPATKHFLGSSVKR